MSNHKETQCVQHSSIKEKVDNTGSISMPIYQTASYEHVAVGESTGYDYSRLQNPTKHELEMVVKRLEDGDDALAFATGMAATTALFDLFTAGDVILVGDDLYGGTVRFIDNFLRKRGLEIRVVDACNLDAIKQQLDNQVKAIFIETPTNPLMKVVDIQAVANLVHQVKGLVIVDNTFLSPYFQNPLVLGADLVIHSGTKFLAGHNDTLAGFIVSKHPEISERLRFIAKTVGSGLAPFDAWLTLRGIKTLAIRVEKAQQNALAVVQFLKQHPAVKKVYYVGDPQHIGYEINKRQARGSGSMISFEVDTIERTYQILKKVQLITFAESLGGVESLITYPIKQTHADIDRDTLLKNGINDCLLRLSVGIEHADDIIADLKQAFSEKDDV